MMADLRNPWTDIAFRPGDRELLLSYLKVERPPDLGIAPDGSFYLLRWHLVRQPQGGLYLHLQVADDCEQGLHDHPWDNMSTILSGALIETLQENPPFGPIQIYLRSAGETIFRRASAAHRLMLAPPCRYTITLFAFGLHSRDWGFWIDGQWQSAATVTEIWKLGTVASSFRSSL